MHVEKSVLGPAFSVRKWAVVVGVLTPLLVLVAALWMGTRNPDHRVFSGVVAVVNDFQTKFCIMEESGAEWCGGLARSGCRPLALGERVMVIANEVETADGRSLGIGTVVPSGFDVSPCPAR